MANNVIRIHSGNAVAIGVSVAQKRSALNKVVQCVVAGTGAVTASVNLEASVNGVDWTILKTFTLSGTTRASGVHSVTDPYPLYRCNITAITGTAAVVTMDMAI